MAEQAQYIIKRVTYYLLQLITLLGLVETILKALYDSIVTAKETVKQSNKVRDG